MAWLVVAHMTALWAGCPQVHPLLNLNARRSQWEAALVLRCSLLMKRTLLVRRIDLDSETSEPTDNHSDSDDSSAAVVEPIDCCC